MFCGIKRINEVIDPVFLGDDEVEEMINLVLDERGLAGTPVRRGSWKNFPLPPLPGGIRSVFELKSGQGDKFIAALAGDSLYFSGNGENAWAISSSGFENSESCGRIETGSGRVLIHSGYTSKVVGGTNFTEVEPIAILPPEINGVAPVTAKHYDTGGSIAQGWYNFVLVYESESGDISSPSLPFTAYKGSGSGSTGFSGTSNRVEIGNLPVPTDKRVTKKKLYRTRAITTSSLSASPFIYYELANLLPDETTFVDKTHDDDLSSFRMAKFATTPEGIAHSFNKGRLFIGNVKTPELNFFSPPYSNDGVAGKIFSGTATIMGGEIFNASDYKYLLVYVDENGTESGAIVTPIISTPGEEHENMAAITLDYLPFLPSSESTRIVEKRLYRTKRDGNVFFRHPVKLGLNQILYTDITADSELGTVTYNSNLKINHFPSSLLYSEPGNYYTFQPENIITLPQGSNCEIVEIFDDVDGILIFTETTISKLYTSGDPVTWRIITIFQGIGAENRNSILKTRKGIYFFSNGNFRFYSGGGITSPGDPILKTLSEIRLFFQPVWYPAREWCCFPVEFQSGARMMLVYDEKNGAWYKFTHPGLKGVSNFSYQTNHLLGWTGTSICEYDQNLFSTDIVGEVDSEIEVEIRSRTITLTGFDLMRLRMLRLYFDSLPGEVDTSLLSENGTKSKQFIISEEAETIKVIPVSGMNGTADYCRRICARIKGTGLKILRRAKLESRRVRS
ncbi:hypothetical protein MASR1M107_12440 [Ignavibacteriales bacterium]